MNAMGAVPITNLPLTASQIAARTEELGSLNQGFVGAITPHVV